MVCFVLVFVYVLGVWTNLCLDANDLVQSCSFTTTSFAPTMTATETSAGTGTGETVSSAGGSMSPSTDIGNSE